MPTIHDLKNSRFLQQHDVVPDKLVTITRWHQEDVSMESEPEKLRYCLDFSELDKPLVLNNINGDTIAQITGIEDFDGWIGKRIVLFRDPNVINKGQKVGGIRVRAPRIRPAAVPVPAGVASVPQPVMASPIPPSLSQRRPAPVPVPQHEPPGELPPGVVEDDDVPF
jgi:hypothetical protein